MISKDENGLIKMNIASDENLYYDKSYEIKLSEKYFGIDSSFKRSLSFKMTEEEKKERFEEKKKLQIEQGTYRGDDAVGVGDYKNVEVDAYLNYQLNADKFSIITRFPVRKIVRICASTSKKKKWARKIFAIGCEIAEMLRFYQPYSSGKMDFSSLSPEEQEIRMKENEEVYLFRDTLKKFCSNFFGKDFDLYYFANKENKENPFNDLNRIQWFFSDFESYYGISEVANSVKPSVRKAIAHGEGAFQAYKTCLKAGIKETNNQVRFIENFYNFVDIYKRAQINLLKNLIKLHGETATVNKVIKFKDTKEHEFHDLIHSMYCWWWFTKEPYRVDDFKGTMLDIHDRFVIMHRDARATFRNKPISYSEREKKLASVENGYSFKIPDETRELVNIGDKMRICVGSYDGLAAYKSSTIVYVEKDGNLEACIELKNYKKGSLVKTDIEDGLLTVVQCKGYRNSFITNNDSLYQTILKWANDRGISRACNDLTIKTGL